MSSTDVFTWTFTPPDYYEEEFEFTIEGQTMKVGIGTASAEVPSAVFEADRGIRQRLHEGLSLRLRAVQVLTHEPYSLSKSTWDRKDEDGRVTKHFEAEPAVITIRCGRADLQLIDANGAVIADPRRDRIRWKRDFMERVAALCSRDATFAAMIESQDRAVRDPNNELVHLYEIADALETKFGKRKRAHDAVRITGADWKRFGDICNERELRQGRHRGQSLGKLRDAKAQELNEARAIARRMIEGYLDYLERQPNANTAP